MKCNKVTSYLNAYADNELPDKQRSKIERHLETCEGCRTQLNNLCLLGNFLDALPVPPVPEGFTARVMAEAKTRYPETKLKWLSHSFIGKPLRWFVEFPTPMRLATCATVMLACIAGLTMDRSLTAGTQGQVTGAVKNLYGLELFDPTPPGSVGSIYLAMTVSKNEEGNTQ